MSGPIGINISRIFEIDVITFHISTFLQPKRVLDSYQLVSKSICRTVNTRETWFQNIKREVPDFKPSDFSETLTSVKLVKKKYFHLTSRRKFEYDDLVSKYNANYHCTIKSVILDRPKKELVISIDERGDMSLGSIQGPKGSSLFVSKNQGETPARGKYRYRSVYRTYGLDPVGNSEDLKKRSYVDLKLIRSRFDVMNLREQVKGDLIYRLPIFEEGDRLVFSFGYSGYSQECLLFFSEKNIRENLLAPFLKE